MQNFVEAVIGNAIARGGEEKSAADKTTAKQNNAEERKETEPFIKHDAAAQAMYAAEKVVRKEEGKAIKIAFKVFRG